LDFLEERLVWFSLLHPDPPMGGSGVVVSTTLIYILLNLSKGSRGFLEGLNLCGLNPRPGDDLVVSKVSLLFIEMSDPRRFWYVKQYVDRPCSYDFYFKGSDRKPLSIARETSYYNTSRDSYLDYNRVLNCEKWPYDRIIHNFYQIGILDNRWPGVKERVNLLTERDLKDDSDLPRKSLPPLV